MGAVVSLAVPVFLRSMHCTHASAVSVHTQRIYIYILMLCQYIVYSITKSRIYCCFQC